MTDLAPSIYVACLASYNNGILHGDLIDATQEPDDIMADVQTVLKESPMPNAEEWAIHDYNDFAGLSLSEYESFEKVHELAAFLQEHGKLGRLLLENFDDTEEADKAITESYCGEYTCIGNFAEELTESTTQIPNNLVYYIDYRRMGRDMELSGDIFTVITAHDEVHVFWSH